MQAPPPPTPPALILRDNLADRYAGFRQAPLRPLQLRPWTPPGEPSDTLKALADRAAKAHPGWIHPVVDGLLAAGLQAMGDVAHRR